MIVASSDMFQICSASRKSPVLRPPLDRWINMDQHGSTWTGGFRLFHDGICNRPMISELENRKNIPYSIPIDIDWICGIRFCSTFCIDLGPTLGPQSLAAAFYATSLLWLYLRHQPTAELKPCLGNGKGNLGPGNSSGKEGSVSDGFSCLILPNKYKQWPRARDRDALCCANFPRDPVRVSLTLFCLKIFRPLWRQSFLGHMLIYRPLLGFTPIPDVWPAMKCWLKVETCAASRSDFSTVMDCLGLWKTAARISKCST